MLKAAALIVIFSVVLYFLLRSSKNFIFTKTFAGSSSGIQIKGSKIIGPHKWLYIVDVLGHILLLGVTEKQVTVLLDMPFENLSEEEKRLWNDEVKTSEPNFKKLLHHWLRK